MDRFPVLFPIVFEDDEGNRYECWTDRQFDEAMDNEGWHLVFD